MSTKGISIFVMVLLLINKLTVGCDNIQKCEIHKNIETLHVRSPQSTENSSTNYPLHLLKFVAKIT
jgi:hypothetical protein